MSSNLSANVRKPEPSQQWQRVSKLSPSRLQALGSSGWEASGTCGGSGGWKIGVTKRRKNNIQEQSGLVHCLKAKLWQPSEPLSFLLYHVFLAWVGEFYWVSCVQMLLQKQFKSHFMYKDSKVGKLSKMNKENSRAKWRGLSLPLFLTVFTSHFKSWPHGEVTIYYISQEELWGSSQCSWTMLRYHNSSTG